jgi:dipeptidyl aminopeptidase/acylaminoacyl peptidase
MRKLFLALVVGALAIACGDDPLGPPGTLLVRVTTTGVDRDAAFAVRAGGETHATIGSPATVQINELRAGQQEIVLEGIAPNCSPSGGPSRSVRVKSGTTTDVEFVVACSSVTGVIAVATAMHGQDYDVDGFSVQVGTTPMRTLSPGDSTFVTGLTAGSYPVTLSGLAANCTASGSNPRSVNVTVGGAKRDTVRAVFDVVCTPIVGSVRVTTRTAGTELDANGYTLAIAGGIGVATIGANGVVTITGIRAGAQVLRLDNVADNCSVSNNPQPVTVVANAVIDASFDIVCFGTRGDVRIVTRTTGSNLDPDGYSVFISNVAAPVAVPVNGSVTASGVPIGVRNIGLGGLAANCTVVGSNPRPIAVVPGETIEVVFEIVCMPLMRIEVTAVTSGVNPDRDGYNIRVIAPGFGREQTVAASGAVTFDALPYGSYTVTLTDLAPNCEVSDGSARAVAATTSVVRVGFAIACVTPERIAFAGSNSGSSSTEIYTSNADGSGITQITNNSWNDDQPAWSAATSRIAFRSQRDNRYEIFVMNQTGTGQARLTENAGNNYSPAWSPDGARIAFVSERDGNAEIYVMNADGGDVVRLTSSPEHDLDPAWSPDGTKILFTRGTCDVYGCVGNIWSMRPDGQGVVRLTASGLDAQPAWSPDGTKIVFARLNSCGYAYPGYYYSCERNLAVMNADGTGVTPLIGDGYDESSPSWSPDGARIVLTLGFCTDYWGCYTTGIRMVRPDGSDPVLIRPQGDFDAIFRR